LGCHRLSHLQQISPPLLNKSYQNIALFGKDKKNLMKSNIDYKTLQKKAALLQHLVQRELMNAKLAFVVGGADL
jgi:hypothetical protein